MALYKDVRQNDGVTTKYHRILYLNKMINSHISIAVVSYVDEESRQYDIAGENRPYRQAVTYEIEYDEDMTINGAYEYLKTLPKFSGAEDV